MSYLRLQLAVRLKDKEHLFILGKGYSEPIALEGALKLKEMAYIHAEGYRWATNVVEIRSRARYQPPAHCVESRIPIIARLS